MALNTKYPSKTIIIADDPDNIVFGTAMIGDTFGEVESITVSRDADLEELERSGGSLLAAIMTKANFTLTMKTIFSVDVNPPGLGEIITFPLANIEGRIIPTIDVEWEKKGQRMLSIKAKSWDDLTTNNGAGSAVTSDGTTTTPIF